MLNNDETVSLTVTQNESPPTIAEQPYFHQLAPQSLLHSAPLLKRGPRQPEQAIAMLPWC